MDALNVAAASAVALADVVTLILTLFPAVPSTVVPFFAPMERVAPPSSVKIPLASAFAKLALNVAEPDASVVTTLELAKLIVPDASAPIVVSLNVNVVEALAAAEAAGTSAVMVALVAAAEMFTLTETVPAEPRFAESICKSLTVL